MVHNNANLSGNSQPRAQDDRPVRPLISTLVQDLRVLPTLGQKQKIMRTNLR